MGAQGAQQGSGPTLRPLDSSFFVRNLLVELVLIVLVVGFDGFPFKVVVVVACVVGVVGVVGVGGGVIVYLVAVLVVSCG
jgi:hypothetical protein